VSLKFSEVKATCPKNLNLNATVHHNRSINILTQLPQPCNSTIINHKNLHVICCWQKLGAKNICPMCRSKW